MSTSLPVTLPLPSASDDESRDDGRGVATPFVFAGLVLLALALLFLELMIGPVNVPFGATVDTLLGREVTHEAWETIVWSMRLPRAITAMLAGAALAAAGLQMQTLFRNPLADPWFLGIVSGARLGVAVVMVLVGLAGMGRLGGAAFLADLSIIGAALVGAATALAVLLTLSKRVGVVTLLVLGVVSDHVVSGMISIILHFSTEIQLLSYVGWNDGRFSGVTWDQLGPMALLIVAGVAITLVLGKALNALLLGERYASSLGANVRLTSRLSLVSTALLAGTVTAYCGPVSFIGVAVPHLCRGLFKTSDHRILMRAVLLVGAILAQTADFITNLPWRTHVLHLNACLAMLGGPVVLWVVLRHRAMRELSL